MPERVFIYVCCTGCRHVWPAIKAGVVDVGRLTCPVCFTNTMVEVEGNEEKAHRFLALLPYRADLEKDGHFCQCQRSDAIHALPELHQAACPLYKLFWEHYAAAREAIYGDD